MRLFSKILTFMLVVTLVGGIGLAAYLIWMNVPLSPALPPSIEFTSVEVGDIVTIAVTARGERIVRAELWSDSELIAREVNPNPALSNPWSIAWQWQPPHPGVFPLAARAFDQAGQYGGTALFNVIIPPKGRLLYSSNRDGSYALYEMQVNTRATALWQPAASDARQPAIGSGKTVAYASNKNGGWQLVTRPLDQPVVTELTADLLSAQHPSWSKDGKLLAFEVTSGSTTNVFVSDAQGKNRRQVTNSDSYDGQASFSPDGQHLAFTAQQGSQWDIYSIALDGSNLTRLTNHPAQDAQPAWSPDGSRIAFVSNRSGIAQVHIMNADGAAASVMQLTNFPSGAEQPAWSPDGNWLSFVAYTGAGEGNDRRELYLMYTPANARSGTASSALVRLTQNNKDDTEPAWVLE